MTDNDTPWMYLDEMHTDDLPPMPAGVDMALRQWCLAEHGLSYGRHYVGHFLDLLAEHGYTVERSVVAGARSYTTLETAEFMRQPEVPREVTSAMLEPPDMPIIVPEGEEPPARSLG